MIWAVVLAAGESRRMGEPKQLLRFRGKTVIEAALDQVLASAVSRTIVVLGAAADRIAPLLADGRMDITVNPDYRSGMLSSVRWGLRHIPGTVKAAMICLGDQPWIQASVMNGLIAAYGATGKGLVLPVHGQRGGHPLLLDMKYLDALDRLEAGQGLKALLTLYSGDVYRLPVGDPDILRDMDTPAEYEKIILNKGEK